MHWAGPFMPPAMTVPVVRCLVDGLRFPRWGTKAHSATSSQSPVMAVGAEDRHHAVGRAWAGSESLEALRRLPLRRANRRLATRWTVPISRRSPGGAGPAGLRVVLRSTVNATPTSVGSRIRQSQQLRLQLGDTSFSPVVEVEIAFSDDSYHFHQRLVEVNFCVSVIDFKGPDSRSRRVRIQ